MKNNKKQKASQKETQLSIVPGITVIALIMAAVFAVLFIFLWRSDKVTLYFAGIFSSSSDPADDGNSSVGDIRLPAESGVTLSEDLFYTPDFTEAGASRESIADFLRTVRCADCYEQMFMVSYQSGPTAIVSVLRNGDKYRVETSDVIVVCDGSTVYLRRTVEEGGSYEHRWNVGEGAFSVENEIGIPSLEDIIAGVEQSEMRPVMTFDDRKKALSIMGIGEGDLVKEATVAYETGIVLKAFVKSWTGDTLYQCSSVFYTLNPEFPEEAFAIPMS